MNGVFSGFVQKRIKPICSEMVKIGKKQVEKTTLEKTANLAADQWQATTSFPLEVGPGTEPRPQRWAAT